RARSAAERGWSTFGRPPLFLGGSVSEILGGGVTERSGVTETFGVVFVTGGAGVSVTVFVTVLNMERRGVGGGGLTSCVSTRGVPWEGLVPGQVRDQWRSPQVRQRGASMVLPRTIEMWLAAAGIVGLVVGIIVYEVAVWRECLDGQSWWYC